MCSSFADAPSLRFFNSLVYLLYEERRTYLIALDGSWRIDRGKGRERVDEVAGSTKSTRKEFWSGVWEVEVQIGIE